MQAKIHTGGAVGADEEFARIGTFYGFEIFQHSFPGHSIAFPCSPIIHTDEELQVSSNDLLVASKHLRKCYPPNNAFVRRLLQRNWFQVHFSDAIIAVAPIEDNRTQVRGGTGWAVALGIAQKLPIHVFDGRWYFYHHYKQTFLPGALPPPYKSFAGIGSRNLTPGGKEAIQRYIKYVAEP